MSILLTPLSYIRITNKHKMCFDWYTPLFITVIIFIPIVFSPIPTKFIGNQGIVYYITDLLKILIGFYIAGLAALATLDNHILDEKIQGEPCILKRNVDGQDEKEDLSRRRFLCYMFGYLALLTLVLFFTGVSASWLYENFSFFTKSIPDKYNWIGTCVKFTFKFIYLFFVCQLFVLTALGLHYLSDRIHR